MGDSYIQQSTVVYRIKVKKFPAEHSCQTVGS